MATASTFVANWSRELFSDDTAADLTLIQYCVIGLMVESNLSKYFEES